MTFVPIMSGLVRGFDDPRNCSVSQSLRGAVTVRSAFSLFIYSRDTTPLSMISAGTPVPRVHQENPRLS